MNRCFQRLGPLILFLVGSPAVACGEELAGFRGARESRFGIIDYLSLLTYLIALVGIGIYFSRREKTSNDFFLGGGRIPWWAAGLSMMAAQVSSIGFMAVPAKSYATDWAYFAGVATWFIVVPIITRAYIPFFRRLNVTSAYEYLEKRFHVSVRLCGTFVYSALQFSRMAIVLYLPGLALSTVTGISKEYCILVTGVIVTAYTMAGGIEAVVWIDAAQAILLIGGALLCIGIVLIDIGDVGRFWEIAQADGKFRLADLDWDVTKATLWVVLAGNLFARLGELSSDQAIVQRYMTTRDEKAARKSLWTNVGMSIPWATLAFFLGTALYVFYKIHPDMLAPALDADAIVPWFIVRNVPAGLSGLIIAALFAATSSSLNSSIHGVATVWVTDFIVRLRPQTTDATRLRLARGFVLLLGAFATATALWMAQTQILSLWDRFQTIVSMFIGGLAGLFALGIFTRRAHTVGALCGLFSSAVVLAAVIYFTVIHFFLYAGIGFSTCCVIGYLSSLLWSGRRCPHGLTIYDLRKLPT
jgi:solute:Na+ symporter, SSS family